MSQGLDQASLGCFFSCGFQNVKTTDNIKAKDNLSEEGWANGQSQGLDQGSLGVDFSAVSKVWISIDHPITSKSTMKFASGVSGMNFGRTDVLIGVNDAPSPELSYGHGLEGASVHWFSKAGSFFFCSKSAS